jgi:hypothetical protein
MPIFGHNFRTTQDIEEKNQKSILICTSWGCAG